MGSRAAVSGRGILCIEDDAETCDLLNCVFSGSDYELVTANNLAEGIGLARSQPLALYILDNRLPDGTGVEACVILKRLTPEIPVLFCSAAAFDHDRQEALAAGAAVYLTKPVELDSLMDTVRKLAPSPPVR
jgi:two-component system, NtrC family, response regulator AtoC